MADPIKHFALVTGGSSGIGLAIARELAAKGYNILLVSNQAQALADCSALIRQEHGVDCIHQEADLSDPDSAKQIYAYCLDKNLVIDVLVNNAGMLIFSEVADVPETKLRTILNLHMHTPVLFCRLFGEAMRQRGTGFILNVASISAVMPYPGISLYGPTKTFMRQFTRAFRFEMQAHGVQVCAVLPGATETALYDPNKVNLKLAKRLGIMHSADFVAREAVEALFQGKAERIPGWLNRITVFILPAVPHFLIRFIYRHTGWLAKGKEILG